MRKRKKENPTGRMRKGDRQIMEMRMGRERVPMEKGKKVIEKVKDHKKEVLLKGERRMVERERMVRE